MPSSKHILITGGTGLIGGRLTALLLQKGYAVAHLSRSTRVTGKVRTYIWNIGENYIENGALENASHVIHLAGENLGEKRWTESRKLELENSRTDSTLLLFRKIMEGAHPIKSFVSASGVNYYGSDTGDRFMKEDDPPGSDFIGRLCIKWETQSLRMQDLNIRTTILRSGLALSANGGFLKALVPIAKAGLNAPIGSGKQYISWIHIDDLCRMYIKAIEDESMYGIFNAAAPHPVANKAFMKRLSSSLKRPFIFPPVPGIALKLFLGELASTILGGVRVSTERIESEGFQFYYPNLKEALNDIFHKSY